MTYDLCVYTDSWRDLTPSHLRNRPSRAQQRRGADPRVLCDMRPVAGVAGERLSGWEALMPRDKDFKRLVRRRMVETGERYTTARAALEENGTSLPAQVRQWLSLLGGDQASNTYKLLEKLPTEARRSAALHGLGDPDWRVRSRCAQLLDNLALTEETKVRLLEVLDDDYPRVRCEAFHTLTCEHCKPEACEVDIRGIAGKMVDDPTPRVRRAAAQALSHYFVDEAITKLRELLESDPSPRVRRETPWKLARALNRRNGYEAYLALPSSLRATLEEKYLGKWVGVFEGKVVSAHESRKLVRREVRGLGLEGKAVLCLVQTHGPRLK